MLKLPIEQWPSEVLYSVFLPLIKDTLRYCYCHTNEASEAPTEKSSQVRMGTDECHLVPPGNAAHSGPL